MNLIEKIVDLQKIYDQKVKMLNFGQKERIKQIKEERRENGLCVYCGNRKADIEKGFISCYPCRLENRKRKKRYD